MPEASDYRSLNELSQRLVREYWDFYPNAGSRIGRHEYDGRLPSLSATSLRHRVAQLNRGLAEVTTFPTETLTLDERLSHRLLELFLRREHFSITEMKNLGNNPTRQVGYLDVSGYLNRDYAPLPDRVRSVSSALKQVPEFVEVMADSLGEQVGLPVLDSSIESYSGMARFYRVDLGRAAGDVGFRDVQEEFDLARENAAASLDQFVSALQEVRDKARPEFAIGPDLYSSMLRTGEALNVPLDRLVSLGEADLNENLRRLKDATAAIDPGREVREVVAGIGSHHPAASDLIPETRDMLEEIRRSVIDLDVVTVPSEDRCLVVETPTYMRYAFAAMDSAGALEERATESFYYVTPVEPEWTHRQQEEWLSNFNYSTLRIVSIHEVYPGHFVHHLHNRYGYNLPLINRVANSYAFVEGWAHYTEEMMLEGGYGSDQPELLVTQLVEALVRNCRYMCSLGMHTGGMTLDDATRYFMENAFMAELPARREALRGTFDPGYLNYTLGKLMIMKLREDYRQERGGNFTLKGFHDQLLSYGAPALPLLRETMLEDPSGPPV